MNTSAPTLPADAPAYTRTFARHGGKHGRYSHTIKLDAEELAYFQQLAKEMGLSLGAFLRGWLERSLPHQKRHRDQGQLAYPALPLDFVPEDLLRRLARVADFRETSLQELIIDDLEQTVELYEADMVFQPQTGEIMADNAGFSDMLANHREQDGKEEA